MPKCVSFVSCSCSSKNMSEDNDSVLEVDETFNDFIENIKSQAANSQS